MYKPHRKPWPKSKTSYISKQSPSPLHHTFLLGRARFTAQPLSALNTILCTNSQTLYTEGLERLRRRQDTCGEGLKLFSWEWDPVHMYQFLFESGYFLLRVWPTVLTYPLKMVTENASFQKRSPEWKFWKRRLFVYLWTDKNGFRIRWCHTSYTSPLAWRMFRKRCYDRICNVLAFSCGPTKTLRVRYVWMRIFVENREKTSVFKNIRIHDDGAQAAFSFPWVPEDKEPTLNCWNLFWLLARMVQYIA